MRSLADELRPEAQMSRVTTIFVFCALADEEEMEAVLGKVCRDAERSPFQKLDPRECGGEKAAQSASFWAAYNLLGYFYFLSDLKKAVDESSILFPEHIQMLYKEEDDEIFTLRSDFG